MTSLAARVRGRGGALVRAARRHVQDLAPLRSNVLRTPDDQVPPPPSAFAAYGDDAWVVPPARVLHPEQMSLGAGAVVMEYSTLAAFGAPLTIGQRVRLSRFCTVIAEAELTIGDDVATSDGVSILASWRSPIGGTLPDVVPPPAPVHIGAGAYLGMACTILPGVTVGAGAYVAENAVVVDDVPAHTVAVGNPARIVRTYDATTGWEGKRWP